MASLGSLILDPISAHCQDLTLKKKGRSEQERRTERCFVQVENNIDVTVNADRT